MKRRTFILISILTVIYACGNQDRQPTISDVEQRLKDWMFFDTGSFWVYKDMNSGNIDSQFVVSSFLKYIEVGKENKKVEYLKLQHALIYLSNGQYLQISHPSASSIIQKISNSGSGRTTLFFKQLYLGGYSHGIGGSITNIDYNYHFGNVNDTLITLLDLADYSERGDSVEYKILRGVGIISKKNLFKKEDWQLMKFKINLNKQ